MRCLLTSALNKPIMCYQCVCSECYPRVCPLPSPTLSPSEGEREADAAGGARQISPAEGRFHNSYLN